jgi:hypothetical protein
MVLALGISFGIDSPIFWRDFGLNSSSFGVGSLPVDSRRSVGWGATAPRS